MTARAQLWLMRLLSAIAYVAVVAVMVAVAFAGEAYWGFR